MGCGITGLQLLAFFHRFHQVAVAGFFHLGERDEFQAGAVDAVAQAAFVFRAVGEDVAEVGVSNAASDFGAVHVVAVVVVFGDDRAVDGLGEARPTAAGLEFVGRGSLKTVSFSGCLKRRHYKAA